MAEARPQIDKAIREQGEYDSLDDAMREAGKELGIDSLEDVIKLLNGETVVAVWFPDGDDDGEGALIAQVDQGKAETLLKKIAAASKSKPETRKVGNAEMTTFRDADGDDSAYAFLDGNLVLGTSAGVERVLANKEPGLGSLAKYNKTVSQMPSGLGTYAYIDLARVLRLAQGGIPADLSKAERALEGLIINGVDERGVVRLSGILTVDK